MFMLALHGLKSSEISSKVSSTQGGCPSLVRGTEGHSEPRCWERKMERRRFANSTCPVRIHHVWHVL